MGEKKKVLSIMCLSVLMALLLPAVALGQTVEEVIQDPHCLENNLFDDSDDPQFGRVRVVGVAPRFGPQNDSAARPISSSRV